MKLFTIGFTKKSAEELFEILIKNGIQKVVDIRLNNLSQLAGFTKGSDFKFFLDAVANIKYIHDLKLAPTKSILDDYKKKKINWNEYEKVFLELLHQRNSNNNLLESFENNYDHVCLLCSEDKPDYCHRRLVAEFIQNNNPALEIKIVHL